MVVVVEVALTVADLGAVFEGAGEGTGVRLEGRCGGDGRGGEVEDWEMRVEDVGVGDRVRLYI